MKASFNTSHSEEIPVEVFEEAMAGAAYEEDLWRGERDFRDRYLPAQIDRDVVKYEPSQSIEELADYDVLVIRPSWRYVPGHLLLALVFGYLAVILSDRFPASVFVDHVGTPLGDFRIAVPIFLIPTLFIMLRAFYIINNQCATMDDENLRFYQGVLSLRRDLFEMETATMLVVSVSQSPLERLLGVGTVSVGRFSRKSMEIDIPGVSNPQKCVRTIKRRIRIARERAKNAPKK